MSLDIREVVNITQARTTVPVAARELGEGLFLTDDETLDASGAGSLQRYSSLRAMGSVFATTSEPYKAGAAWFANIPYPRDLWIGRWNTAATVTRLIGTPNASAPDTATKVATARIKIGGTETADIDLSSATTWTAVATAMQTAIRALTSPAWAATATVAYGPTGYAGQMVISLAGTYAHDVITPAYLEAVTTASKTDIKDKLGMGSGDAEYVQGHGQEEADEALNRLAGISTEWYAVMNDTTIEKRPTGLTKDTLPTISTWANSNGRYRAYLATQGTAQYSSTDTASDLAALIAIRNSRTVVMTYSDSDPFKHVSAASVMSSIDYTAPGGYKTLAYKNLSGRTADNLTSAQADVLKDRYANFFTNVGGVPTVLHGTNLDGTYVDHGIFADWLLTTLETEIFSLLRNSNAIPYRERGLNVIKGVIANVCERAVVSGAVAPGDMSPESRAEVQNLTGNRSFNGVLRNGYLIWFPSLRRATQQQKLSRSAPAGKLWVLIAGAIQYVTLSVDIQ